GIRRRRSARRQPKAPNRNSCSGCEGWCPDRCWVCSNREARTRDCTAQAPDSTRIHSTHSFPKTSGRTRLVPLRCKEARDKGRRGRVGVPWAWPSRGAGSEPTDRTKTSRTTLPNRMNQHSLGGQELLQSLEHRAAQHVIEVRALAHAQHHAI